MLIWNRMPFSDTTFHIYPNLGLALCLGQWGQCGSQCPAQGHSCTESGLGSSLQPTLPAIPLLQMSPWTFWSQKWNHLSSSLCSNVDHFYLRLIAGFLLQNTKYAPSQLFWNKLLWSNSKWACFNKKSADFVFLSICCLNYLQINLFNLHFPCVQKLENEVIYCILFLTFIFNVLYTVLL